MESKNNIEMLQEIQSEVKEIYERNLRNSDKIDTKIVQFFTLYTATLILFIEFIEVPKLRMYYRAYLIIIVLFVSILVWLMVAYKPLRYGAIDPNEFIKKYNNGGYKSREDILKSVSGTTAENVISIKENIIKKSSTIEVCGFVYIIILILIIILRITQGT